AGRSRRGTDFNDFIRRRFWAQPCRSWFPSCGKNGVRNLTQKKNVFRTPCGAPSVTVTKSHKHGMKGDTVNIRRPVRVKTKVPWMPPGKSSARHVGCKWEVGSVLFRLLFLDWSVRF
ncbi:Outer dense fiber protein 2, partial [Lemmus lemmus]